MRELQNLVERGVIAAEDGSPIDLPHLFRDEETTRNLLYSIDTGGTLASDTAAPAAAGSALEHFRAFAASGDSKGPSLDDLEARLVREAVAQADGNLTAAARLLGLTRSRLAYRMKKLRTEAAS